MEVPGEAFAHLPATTTGRATSLRLGLYGEGARVLVVPASLQKHLCLWLAVLDIREGSSFLKMPRDPPTNLDGKWLWELRCASLSCGPSANPLFIPHLLTRGLLRARHRSTQY